MSMGKAVRPSHQPMGFSRVQRHPILQQGGQRRKPVATKGLDHSGATEQFSETSIETIPMGEHRCQLFDEVLRRHHIGRRPQDSHLVRGCQCLEHMFATLQGAPDRIHPFVGDFPGFP